MSNADYLCSMIKEQRKVSFEFISLMAALMSIVALSIDAILPAIANISEDIGSTSNSSNQALVSFIFLGLGVGQLVFGPLSDQLGRKPVIYIGIIISLIAGLWCTLATSVPAMLAARLLQGFGLSTPRTIAIAIIRDKFSGNLMGRVMSFVTAFFILIPMIAPFFGQFILDVWEWRGFYINGIFAFVVMLWCAWRQEET